QVRPVLADHEETGAAVDAEEQRRGAEVAVGDPQVARPDQFQDRVGQRAFLGVAALTGDDIDDQHQLGVEDHQGLARQGPGPSGPQRPDAMLGAGEMVAVKDLDVVAIQPGLLPRPQLVDDGGEGRCGVANQGGAGGRLDAINLVVNRLAGDAQGRGHLLVGGIDRGSDAADDQAHEIDDAGEEQSPGVLLLGVVFEQLVDGRRWQGVLQNGLDHDGNRGILNEPLEDIAEDHGCRSVGESLNPWEPTVYQNV